MFRSASFEAQMLDTYSIDSKLFLNAHTLVQFQPIIRFELIQHLGINNHGTMNMHSQNIKTEKLYSICTPFSFLYKYIDTVSRR